MANKYGNNTPPYHPKRLPDGFYLDNGVPRIENMILPSDKTIDKILQPFYWVKNRVRQSMEDGCLSPFPSLPEVTDKNLMEVVDFIKSYKGGTEVKSIDKDIRKIQDFLNVPGSQIYPEFIDDGYTIKIHCYHNGVYHNQLDYSFDAFSLYQEM